MMAFLRRLWIVDSGPPAFNSDSGGVMDTEWALILICAIDWYSIALRHNLKGLRHQRSMSVRCSSARDFHRSEGSYRTTVPLPCLLLVLYPRYLCYFTRMAWFVGACSGRKRRYPYYLGHTDALHLAFILQDTSIPYETRLQNWHTRPIAACRNMINLQSSSFGKNS